MRLLRNSLSILVTIFQLCFICSGLTETIHSFDSIPAHVAIAVDVYFDPATTDYEELQDKICYWEEKVWCKSAQRYMWYITLSPIGTPGFGEFDVVIDAVSNEVLYYTPLDFFAASEKLDGIPYNGYMKWRNEKLESFETTWGKAMDDWTWEEWIVADFETSKACTPFYNFWYITTANNAAVSHDMALEIGKNQIRFFFPEANSIEREGDALYIVEKPWHIRASYPLPLSYWQIVYNVDGSRYYIKIDGTSTDKVELTPVT